MLPRCHGARTALGFQFLQQIRDETVREAIRNLCQSRFLFQTRNQDDATDFAREMLRTWSNMIQNSAEAQDQLNFGPDDLLRMPRYHCACFWVVHGQARPAFLGETIPSDLSPAAIATAKHRAASRWAAAATGRVSERPPVTEEPTTPGADAAVESTPPAADSDAPGDRGGGEVMGDDDGDAADDPREEERDMPDGAARRPKPVRAPWAKDTGLSADEALAIIVQEGGSMDDFNRAMARLRDQANRKDGVKHPAGLFRFLVRQMVAKRNQEEQGSEAQ